MSDEKQNPNFEYKGYTIIIELDRMTFKILGDEGTAGHRAYADATGYIDRLLARKTKAPKREIKLLAITDQGQTCTIVGYHATNGMALVTPKCRDGFRTSIYPGVSVVTELLAERDRLNAELSRVNDILQRARLKEGTATEDNDDLGRTYERLAADHAAKMKTFGKYSLASILAEYGPPRKLKV
jgi:hypothetical protein